MIAMLLLAITLGCGGPIRTEYIEGTVTYNGVPVASAAVNFSPVGEGNPAYGTTDDSGVFRIQTHLGAPDRGTTQGEYIVTIRKVEPIPSGIFATDPYGHQYEVIERRRSLLPRIYNVPSTSPLRVEVKRGTNRFEFDLVGDLE